MSKHDDRERSGGHLASMSEGELMDTVADPEKPLYVSPEAQKRWEMWKESRGVRCSRCEVVMILPQGVILPGDMIRRRGDGLVYKAGADPICCEICDNLPGAE